MSLMKERTDCNWEKKKKVCIEKERNRENKVKVYCLTGETQSRFQSSCIATTTNVQYLNPSSKRN